MKLMPLMLLSPGNLGESDVQGFARRAQALKGRAVTLLLREPLLHDAAYLVLALELKRRLPETQLVLHDRPQLVARVQADGVHLGFRSLPPASVREQCAVTIGLSTHAGDERDLWPQADYLFHGPVRETASKVGIIEPTGWPEFESVARSCSQPVYALGGMRPEDVQPALSKGAFGVAVLGGVFGPGVESAPAVDKYLAAFEEADA